MLRAGDEGWRAVAIPATGLAVAVAYPTFAGGGFSDSSRAVFVALAGIALMLAVAGGGSGSKAPAGAGSDTAAGLAARAPITFAVVGLGLLSLLSAVWTITSAAAAIRWGLVILGYGAVMAAAAAVAARIGPRAFALGLLALAVAEAILGLQGVFRHALPDAEYLSGRWRPGGSFEYQPALALLEIAALPVLVWLASGDQPRDVRRHAALAVAAACAGVLGFSLGLSGARLEPALGALILALLVAWPPSGFTRRGAVLVTVLAAVAALAALTTNTGSRPTSVAAGFAHVTGSTHHSSRHLGNGAAHHTASSDLLHGRAHEWQAAIQTWEDRPLLGAGAGSYLAASLHHQGKSVSLYAHELPLEAAAELGILGFLLTLAVYAGGARVLFEARGAPLALALLGPMCAVFLISNLLDWTWHLAGLGAIWAAATGALIAAGKPRAGHRTSISSDK